MKGSEIRVGGFYAAKVSDRIVPVEVLEILRRDKQVFAAYGVPEWWACTEYRCRNTVTGREIIVKSPQRFRRAVTA